MPKKREVVSVPMALPREEEEEEEAPFEEEIAPEEEIPLEEEEVPPEEEEVPPEEEEVLPEEEEILPEEEVLPEEEEALPEISPKVPRPAPGTAILGIKTSLCRLLSSLLLKSSILLSVILCWVVIKALKKHPRHTFYLTYSNPLSMSVYCQLSACLNSSRCLFVVLSSDVFCYRSNVVMWFLMSLNKMFLSAQENCT